MEREACVCDHGFERSDLCAEIIIIIIIISGWRIKIVAECGYTHQIVGQKWVPGGALLSRGRVWPVDVPETSCKSMPTL